jgi:hypothetical protein
LSTPPTAAAAPPRAEKAKKAGFIDPRLREPPPTHRWRLGFELDYIRLSQAVDSGTGKTQRFHFLPLQVDFAYQFQFLKYLMLRPSLAFGGNVANTMEAMPVTIHPQFHTGYQGSILGVALGYGWFTPLVRRKDAVSAVRGGLGQPIIVNNHHIGVELSATTRIDRGALSLQVRFAGVNSRLQHFALDERKWRFMFMFSAGWYFGDREKQERRRRERKARREEKRY